MNINSRYLIGHQFSPGRERRACCGYLNQGHGLSPLPQGKTTTPNYSLKHARSGSDTYTASTSSTVASTSPLQAVAILPLSDFHEISRAAGPKRHLQKKKGGGGQPCLTGPLPKFPFRCLTIYLCAASPSALPSD